MSDQNPIKRFRRWLDSSFSHRVTAYTMLIAMIAVSVLGLLSYLTIGHLVSQRVEAELVSHGAVPQSRLQYRIDSLMTTAASLAERSIVRNALADSGGRRAYLDPFLRELVSSESGIWNVAITDYKGEDISFHGNPSADAGQSAALAASVVASNTPAIHLYRDSRNDHAHLVVVSPILYPRTGTVEGALRLELDLDRMFADASVLAEAGELISLIDNEGRLIAMAGTPIDGPVLSATLPIVAGDVQMTARVETSVWRVYTPMLSLLGIFILLGALSLFAIARFSARAAEAVTRPVRALSALAQEIATGGTVRKLECRVDGEDEIASLASAFNRMIHTIYDHHERLESEVRRRTDALAEAQSRLSGILESIQDMLYSVDLRDGRTRYLSPAAAPLMGLPAATTDLDIETFRGCVHSEDQAAVDAMMAQVRDSGFAELRYRIIGFDGTERWVRERVYLVFDDAGEPCRIDGIVVDVSARMAAERARRDAERGLRLKDQALASSSNGVLILDVSGEAERIVYSNDAFHDMTGYLASDTDGRDWRFLHADSEDRFAVEELRAAVVSRRQAKVTFRLRCKDGALRWVELSVAPVRSGDGDQIDHMVGVFNDIHDRVIGEQRYRNVVDSVKEVIFQTDREGRWVFLNTAWARVTGYTVRESLGLNFLDFIHPEDREAYRETYAEMARGHQHVCEHEIRYITRDGETRWMSVYARSTVDEFGMVQGFTGTLIDMTERHQWEEELHLRDRALQASSNGIVIADTTRPDNPIIYANPAFERMTGYAQDEILGHNCRMLQCEETDQGRLDDIRAALREGSETTVILRNKRKDGSLFWNELSISPVLDATTGAVTHFVGVQNDVTSKLEAEKQLFEWYVRLSTIFTLSPDGFVFFDNTDRLAYLNPAFERMVGLNSGDLEGKTEAEFDEILRGLCDDKLPYVSVFDVDDDPDEDGLCGLSTLTLAGPGPRVLQRSVRHCESDAATKVFYFRDVTRETEVDRMKSEFLSTAAHELRTPMASIMGFSELLLTRKFDENRTSDLLQTINRQSKRLTGLLNELLDLARIEARAGKDFKIERIPLRKLIDETVAALMMPGDERQVQMQLPDQLPDISVDWAKMTQALTNILSNAYKYSPNGGDICLDVIEQPAGEGKRGGLIGIRVSDHGLGMTPEQTAMAFERFFRADDSGNIPGTGLGLSLVKEIVELHGGRVGLESTFGEGTQITLWLPVTPAHARAQLVQETTT